MKFFLPPQKDEDAEKRVYDAIKKFAKQETGWDIKDKRIYRIEYSHEGKHFEAKVGESEKRGGEIVIAILESTVTFFICTPNRGVIRGMPILVGREEVVSIEDFEE